MWNAILSPITVVVRNRQIVMMRIWTKRNLKRRVDQRFRYSFSLSLQFKLKFHLILFTNILFSLKCCKPDLWIILHHSIPTSNLLRNNLRMLAPLVDCQRNSVERSCRKKWFRRPMRVPMELDFSTLIGQCRNYRKSHSFAEALAM